MRGIDEEFSLRDANPSRNGRSNECIQNPPIPLHERISHHRTPNLKALSPRKNPTLPVNPPPRRVRISLLRRTDGGPQKRAGSGGTSRTPRNAPSLQHPRIIKPRIGHSAIGASSDDSPVAEGSAGGMGGSTCSQGYNGTL